MELKHISPRQRYIIDVSIATALSWKNPDGLKAALTDALDAGLSINELNEEIVHLYCYVGFAPSCRATIILMNLIDERCACGIHDEQGREASPVNEDESKYSRGEKLQMFCAGATAEQLRSGFFGFNPLLDKCLKEHLFADIFARDLLSPVEREMITVSALASIEEPMVESHFGGALNVGVTVEQLHELLRVVGGKTSSDVETLSLNRLQHTINNRQKI